MRDVIGHDAFNEDEERLDRAARRLYGTEHDGNLERLLAANPGLAALAIAHGGFLPRGTVLTVPERTEPRSDPALVRPWE